MCCERSPRGSALFEIVAASVLRIAIFIVGTFLFCLHGASADQLVSSPGASLDLTPSTSYNSGGVLAVSVPAQSGFDNSRDFRPIVIKHPTDSGKITSVAIIAYGEILSAIGTEPPVPVDIGAIRDNLVLNLNLFASASEVATNPLGGQTYSVRLSETILTPAPAVTNRFGITNPNVYAIAVDLPFDFQVTSGQSYALGFSFTLVDSAGVPQVNTLMTRIPPATQVNDGSYEMLYATRTVSSAPATLVSLSAATGALAHNVAVAIVVKKPGVPPPPVLTDAFDSTNRTFTVSFRDPVETPERWNLLVTDTLVGGVWLPVSNQYRTLTGDRATWRIPMSVLPPISGFFKVVYSEG